MGKAMLPVTCEIMMEMRDPIRAIRAAGGNETAADSFHSLFLWQKDMKLSICLREEAFAVRCGYWGENSWFFPCGRKAAVVRIEMIRKKAIKFAYRHFQGFNTVVIQI